MLTMDGTQTGREKVCWVKKGLRRCDTRNEEVKTLEIYDDMVFQILVVFTVTLRLICKTCHAIFKNRSPACVMLQVD